MPGVVDRLAAAEAAAMLADDRALLTEDDAIGESGGFSLHLGDTTFYPIQVAEKGFVWIKARITGEPGHGSMPRRDSVINKLGESLVKLGAAAMPVHTRPTMATIRTVGNLRIYSSCCA